MTTEYPIFVPHANKHVAAVVTVPDERARGLVLLLQGLGAPRSHRYRLWTRTARGLAERGIASVRLDYPEMGDSTGSYPLSLQAPPVDEVMAVVDVAAEALGVSAFGVAGNCLGGRTALGMAGRTPNCVSIATILPNSLENVLAKEGRTGPHRAARRLSKKAPGLARRIRRIVRSEHVRLRMRLIPEIPQALRTSRILFLYLGKPEEGDRLSRGLDAQLGSERSRAVVTTIPAENLFGMRLPFDMQPLVVDTIVDWMDRTLPGGQAESDPVSGDGGGDALTHHSIDMAS